MIGDPQSLSGQCERGLDRPVALLAIAATIWRTTSGAWLLTDTDGLGGFNFIAVEAWLEWRTDDGARDERIVFTWEGEDEGDHVSGRGWAKVDDHDQLVGHLYFHLGDDSRFRAIRSQPVWTRVRREHRRLMAEQPLTVSGATFCESQRFANV